MENSILLVDDEKDIRDVLGISLADLGYHVLKAADGKSALEIMKIHQPPILLTDIKMPGMNGIELLKHIKADYPDTEVVVITGHGDMDLAVQSLKLEAADFITKPINEDILEIALKKVREKISLRNQLRQELSTTKHKYQVLFNEAPCYISVIDKSFNLTASNKKFNEDFNIESGIHCYEVFKHRKEQCSECPVAATFADGKMHHTETVVTSKNGKQHNVLIQTTPIKDFHENIVEVMEMSTDITEIRELQDHLSSLGMLIGSISHGIKGLLTGLDGGIYLVNSGLKSKDHERIYEGWEMVKLMISKIRKMVLDILFYAKERSVSMEIIEVSNLSQDLSKTMKSKIESFGIEFVHRCDSDLGKLKIDSQAFHSAIVNIMENALEACTDDKSKPKHTITLDIKSDQNSIIFEIRDNGIGMDTETREKLFTLFFSSKGNKGTGLGLFISNKIVKQHGGEIKVDSCTGEGTTFSVIIPKKEKLA